ncbi:MAG: hypothetical protein HYY14_05385 [Candidatus Omnitrophica bacterium]|nr:hypothetical protein [Candidatus Omnitrophota bacterium]
MFKVLIVCAFLLSAVSGSLFNIFVLIFKREDVGDDEFKLLLRRRRRFIWWLRNPELYFKKECIRVVTVAGTCFYLALFLLVVAVLAAIIEPHV